MRTLVQGRLDALGLDAVAHAELLLRRGSKGFGLPVLPCPVGPEPFTRAGWLAEARGASVSSPTRAKSTVVAIPTRTTRTAARPMIRGSTWPFTEAPAPGGGQACVCCIRYVGGSCGEGDTRAPHALQKLSRASTMLPHCVQ